jgi:hypothetical protein
MPPRRCAGVSAGRQDVAEVAARLRLKRVWHAVRNAQGMIAPAQAALLRGSQDVAAAPATPVARAATPPAETLPLREGELAPMPGTITFGDFLSGLNPLQHLPVVGTIYRAATGDVAPAAMRVAGGFLMGGPLGAVASAVGVMAEAMFSDAGPRLAEAWDARHGGGGHAATPAAAPVAHAAYGRWALGNPAASA